MLDYLLLEDLTKNYNGVNIDKLLLEFKIILENLEDESTIKDYIVYCKGIANSMIEIKENK